MSEFNLAEEELTKLILDSIEHPILFADTDHIIRYLNKPAEKEYYQVRKLKSLIGRKLFSCHPPYAVPTIEKAFDKLVEGEEEVYLYHSHKKDNDLYLRAVRDKEGKLIGYYQRYEKPYDPKIREK